LKITLIALSCQEIGIHHTTYGLMSMVQIYHEALTQDIVS